MLPFPEDPYCYFPGRGQYHSSHVWERCKQTQKLPEDALLIVNVTEKDMFRGRYNFIYIWWDYKRGENTVTYFKWFTAGNEYEIANMLAKGILGCFNMQETCRVCPLKDCLFSLPKGALGIKYRKFAICENCKQLYSKLDIEKEKVARH